MRDLLSGLHLRKVVSGSGWILGFRVFSRVLQVLVLFVAARYFSPEQLGLVGIAALVLSLIETLSQLGVGQMIIARDELSQDDVSVLWTFQLLRGLVGGLLLALLTPLVAAYFKTSFEILFPLMVLFGLMFLIRGATNPGITYFQKDLNFRAYIIFLILGALVGCFSAIGLVVLTKNLVAYVFGLFLGDITAMWLSFRLSPVSVSFNFNWPRFRSLYRFGRQITLSSILAYLFVNVDDFAVGRLLGVSALGIYQMAYAISQMPVTEGMQMLAQVATPVFAKLKDSPLKLRRLFALLVSFVTVTTLLFCALIFWGGDWIVATFLGDQWLPAVPVAKVLLLWGFLHACVGLIGPLFIVLDRMRIVLSVQLTQLILLVMVMVPATLRWGMIGLAFTIFAVALIPNAAGLLSAFLVLRRMEEASVHD